MKRRRRKAERRRRSEKRRRMRKKERRKEGRRRKKKKWTRQLNQQNESWKLFNTVGKGEGNKCSYLFLSLKLILCRDITFSYSEQ
jgi:hypothetical protein